MSKRWYEQSIQIGPDGFIPCILGIARVRFKFFDELLRDEKSAITVEGVHDDEFFKDEEELISQEWAFIKENMGELWFDVFVLVALGIAAVYLYRNQRARQV